MDGNKVDWERLCEHPAIRLLHRIMVVVGGPILLWVGIQFIDMRDAVTRTATVLEQITKTQEDFKQRIRALERQSYEDRP